MFAADFILFSDSIEDLKSLMALESFCNSWNIKRNPTKTKVLIFANTREEVEFNFMIHVSR